MARNYLLWGINGTGKSSFGLEDADEQHPVSYHQFEPNGFRRAATRLGVLEERLPSWIRLHKYRVPVQEMEQLGDIVVYKSGNVKPQVKYTLSGWTDILGEFNSNYMRDCKDGYRPITDTCTRLWLAQQQAWEQQVQEATHGGDAAYLDRLKYTTPNARMSGATEYAGEYELDAVFIAHAKEIYPFTDPPTFKPDCWKESENLVDVVLEFSTSNNKPLAIVRKGAESGMVRNLRIPEPTLRKVSSILDLVAVLESEGETYEKDAESLLMMAQLRGLY